MVLGCFYWGQCGFPFFSFIPCSLSIDTRRPLLVFPLLRVSCLANEIKEGAQRRPRKKIEKIYLAHNNSSANTLLSGSQQLPFWNLSSNGCWHLTLSGPLGRTVLNAVDRAADHPDGCDLGCGVRGAGPHDGRYPRVIFWKSSCSSVVTTTLHLGTSKPVTGAKQDLQTSHMWPETCSIPVADPWLLSPIDFLSQSLCTSPCRLTFPAGPVQYPSLPSLSACLEVHRAKLRSSQLTFSPCPFPHKYNSFRANKRKTI